MSHKIEKIPQELHEILDLIPDGSTFNNIESGGYRQRIVKYNKALFEFGKWLTGISYTQKGIRQEYEHQFYKKFFNNLIRDIHALSETYKVIALEFIHLAETYNDKMDEDTTEIIRAYYNEITQDPSKAYF